jgi:hypothetical protein
MTDKEEYLKELKAHSEGHVVLGDGVKGRVKGIRKLVNPSSPCLDDVLLVERKYIILDHA